MTQPRFKKRSRIRRWFEILLLLAGVASTSAWLASMALPLVWQDWENWVFDHELVGETATVRSYLEDKQLQITDDVSRWLGLTPREANSRPGSVTKGSPRRSSHGNTQNNVLVGRLAIPRLRLTARLSGKASAKAHSAWP